MATQAAAADSGWIGNRITGVQVAAIMAVATASAVVTAVSPVVLSRMVEEGRIATAQIGQVATVEYLLLAIATALSGAFWRPDRVREKMAIVLLIFAAMNLLSAHVSYPLILVVRAVAGICAGLFVWLMVQMFARSTLPARLQGIFVAVQGAVGFGLSLTFANWVVPEFGSAGGFTVLAVASLLVVPVTLLLPRSFSILPGQEGGSGLPPARGYIALAITFLVFAGTLAIWLHIQPLALQQAQDDWVMGWAIPAGVMMQVVGGLTAAALAARLSYRLALGGAWIGCIALAMVWVMGPAGWGFVAITAGFGFLWMLYVPFTLSLTVDLDPSRASVAYLGAVQPLGAAAGPVLGSLAVSGTDVTGAFYVGVALFGASLLLLALAAGRAAPAGRVTA